MVIVPAYRNVRATYAEGYLRRFVFELDQSGNVTRGGILELAGNSTEFLLENEETLISGFLNGIKLSSLTYVWSDFGFSSVETVQADGKEVARSVDRLLNAKRATESFSMMNCIDWYWVYSVDGVVVYEEFSHTTCMDASCDENTELACLDDGLGGGPNGAGLPVEDEGIDCSSFIFSNVNSAWREAGVSRVRFNIIYIDGSRRESKTIEISRPIYFGLPVVVHANPYEAAEFTAGAVQRASNLTFILVEQNPGILEYTIQTKFMEFLQAQMSLYGGTAKFYPSNGYIGGVIQANYDWFGNGDCD